MAKPALPLIIGFSGKIGSGKDYIGCWAFNLEYHTIHLAFSDPIKIHLMATYPDIANYQNMYVNKTAVSRSLLQTEAMKSRETDDLIWIKYLDSWINVLANRGTQIFVITDVRFPIEVDYIKSRGGIIFRIEAPQRTLLKMQTETNNNAEEIEKIKNHVSETSLDHIIWDEDCVLYNDPEIKNNRITLNKIHKKLNANQIYCSIKHISGDHYGTSGF